MAIDDVVVSHAFHCDRPDDPPVVPPMIQPSDWNLRLLFSGGADGALIVRDAAADPGARWLAAGAAGAVLVSTGAGVAPGWTTTPTLAGLSLVAPLAATEGGTGAHLGPFTIGDLPYAGSPASFAMLPAGAAGAVLVAGGAGVAPGWTTTPTLADLSLTGGLTTLGPINVGANAATPFPAGTLLVIGNTDNPANNPLELRGTAGPLSFKNAANTKQYGVIVGGGVSPLGIADLLRINSGGGGAVALQENGGWIVTGPTGRIAFGGLTNNFPALTRVVADPKAMRVRLADDSAYTALKLADLYANQNSAGTGAIMLGGIDADRGYGGLWVGQAAPSFANYTFLANAAGNGVAMFNAPNVLGLVEFRIANATKAVVGTSGLTIHGDPGVAPALPLTVRNSGKTATLFSITDAGQIGAPLLGAFAAGDKYVTIDAAGNLHKSAIGPAS